VEQGEANTLPGLDNNLIEGFRLTPGQANLDNQILILTSYSLIKETLESLAFETVVYRRGLLRSVSYYPMDPIRVNKSEVGHLPLDNEFVFEYLEDNKFHLSTSRRADFKMDTVVQFGQRITLNGGAFTIYPQPELENVYKSGKKIYFKFSDIDKMTDSFRERLNVVAASRDGTILRNSLIGTNPVRDIVFLDRLIEMSMLKNLDKKNHEAQHIISFIDVQLVDVEDSLSFTENQLQEFRSRNMIMDVSAQAQQIIDQAVVLENEKARLNLEANYYAYLDEYLTKESNEEIPISPATMGIDDPTLSTLMQELAGLQAQYFGRGIGERNPMQAQLELRLKNTKQSIRETLQGIKLANQMAEEENENQINRLNRNASRLPIKERQLLGIERKFNLNNVMYTFLLQKRSEAQIQRASNRPDNEVVDQARVESKAISPNKRAAFLAALCLGLGLPLLIIYLADALLNKISSEEDVKMVTHLPIVGYIPHSRLGYSKIVLTEPSSRIAESFRSIRSRLEFFTQDTKCPVIFITSSMPGEGKTFSAINLASAYSLTGKKTMMLGADLRRPVLQKSFDLDEEIGLSTYLIGKHPLHKTIFATGYPNLDVLPAGPIPPNPAELLSSQKAKDLFKNLKTKYEFIIVDSAPMGIISDSFGIAALADLTLIVIKHEFTKKNMLSSTISEAKSIGVKGISLLLNDLKTTGGSYRYSYSYKYKYSQKAVNNT
jgi:tyrosine-protein kinase Etk/Wzc